ncbi:MAG: AAA family ATPase [Candidatus Kerfeldbacteria bacterium]|nr:AAA family ATPase [Candidatus Kerfeldbacteria bacterium]
MEDINFKNLKKGSIWRKWDLQVHTPYSYLNNQFGSNFDVYVQNLYRKAIEKEIAVIAITDYFCIEGYKKIITDYLNSPVKLTQLFSDEEIVKIKEILLLPNIEFRLPILIDGNRVNFHVIFSDQVSVTNIEENFLHELDFVYESDPESADERWKLKIPNLENFGAKLKKEHQNFEGQTDIFTGMKCAVVDPNQIVEILNNKKSKFQNQYLLCIPSDEDLSNVSWDGQGHAIRKSLIQKSHILFSSNVNTVAWGLGQRSQTVEQYVSEFKSLKPCLWGSDAHSYDNLFQPSDNRFTWIKADVTFEGLRQVLFEPEDRVKIQDQNPYFDYSKLSIDRVSILGSKNFAIKDITIPLNRELVTIIGGRGSGKSALLESIALLNESHAKLDINGKLKFIEYYRQNFNHSQPAPNFEVEVDIKDKDEVITTYNKELKSTEDLELPFLYVGQEQLSSLATNDTELTRKICDLIGVDFSAIVNDNLITQARDVVTDVQQLEVDINQIYLKYPAYKRGQNFTEWIADLVNKKEEQKKRLSSATTQALLTDISAITKKGLQINAYKKGVVEFIKTITNEKLNQDIQRLNVMEKEHLDEGEESTPIPSLSFTELLVALNTKISLCDSKSQQLRAEYAQKKQELIKAGLKEDVAVLLQAAETLDKDINNLNSDKENYIKLNELLNAAKKNRLLLVGDYFDSLQKTSDQIESKFTEFKNSREQSTPDERQLFEKIISGISVVGHLMFDEYSFCRYLLDECLDGRTIKTIEHVRDLIAKTDPITGKANVITAEVFRQWAEKELDSFLETRGNFVSHGRQKLIDFIFIDWSRYLKVVSLVKLNNLPTQILSIGQRGTLLLKIYLATASAKQIFIIDQPEDHLDNRFIMNELVPLIRMIKRTRQLILTTHNANLVVNTDAEQIIVAQIDQESIYSSGSIEDPKINSQIIDILEGGAQAFAIRERKYQF